MYLYSGLSKCLIIHGIKFVLCKDSSIIFILNLGQNALNIFIAQNMFSNERILFHNLKKFIKGIIRRHPRLFITCSRNFGGLFFSILGTLYCITLIVFFS